MRHASGPLKAAPTPLTLLLLLVHSQISPFPDASKDQAKERGKRSERKNKKSWKKERSRARKMMVGKEDRLRLSLSLNSPPPVRADDQQHLLTLMPTSSLPPAPPAPASHQQQQQQYWNDVFFCSERRACEVPFLRGIDVNRMPAAAMTAAERESEDDEAGVSSPNSTLSSLSGKRGLPTRSGGGGGDEHDGERASSRGPGSDDEDGGDTGSGSRKKLRLSKDQSAVLEESFKEHNTLNPKQKLALAKQLNLKPRQVEVWFQNRRARTKLKQTEVDCEFLKRCCESLTEENRRLQKEVQELRALKLISPQVYMQMAPPTTLTMCPSCERVISNSSAGNVSPEAAVERSRMQLHRPIPVAAAAAAGVGPNGPWAPLPIRPMFVDGPAKRS